MLLVGGEYVGVQAWVAALVVVVALVGVTRSLPVAPDPGRNEVVLAADALAVVGRGRRHPVRLPHALTRVRVTVGVRGFGSRSRRR